VRGEKEFLFEIHPKGIKLPAQLDLTPREREIILKGGVLNYFKDQLKGQGAKGES
jgi:hypothetical protein